MSSTWALEHVTAPLFNASASERQPRTMRPPSSNAALQMWQHAVAEGFLLWKRDLASLAPIRSPHIRSHLFIWFIASLGMSICIRSAMFSCLHADVYSAIHLRNVCSFFLTGHVYLCLIKQAHRFLLSGPRQEVFWHDIQAWLRWRDLQYHRPWFSVVLFTQYFVQNGVAVSCRCRLFLTCHKNILSFNQSNARKSGVKCKSWGLKRVTLKRPLSCILHSKIYSKQ